jgi:hypothetical protein
MTVLGNVAVCALNALCGAVCTTTGPKSLLLSKLSGLCNANSSSV